MTTFQFRTSDILYGIIKILILQSNKNDTMKTISRISLALSFLLSIGTVTAETLQGRVVGVMDGDTVKVLDAANTQWKIRLVGIDAPEKNQAFGTKSKEHLSDLVYNKQVTIEYSKKDRYGRTLGKILVDGIDANLEQVKAGLAWHYKQYAKEQTPDDQSLYSSAETQAKSAKRGLWVDAYPTPPWEFRHTKK